MGRVSADDAPLADPLTRATDWRDSAIGRLGRRIAASKRRQRWRRWCSRCVEPILMGERIESRLSWPRTMFSKRPQSQPVYRSLVRAVVIDPISRRRRRRVGTGGGERPDGALAAGCRARRLACGRQVLHLGDKTRLAPPCRAVRSSGLRGPDLRMPPAPYGRAAAP